MYGKLICKKLYLLCGLSSHVKLHLLCEWPFHVPSHLFYVILYLLCDLLFTLINENYLPKQVLSKIDTHSYHGFVSYAQNYIISNYNDVCQLPACYICNQHLQTSSVHCFNIHIALPVPSHIPVSNVLSHILINLYIYNLPSPLYTL